MKLSKEQWLKISKGEDKTENRLLELAYTILMRNVYESEGYPWSPYRCISPARCLEEPGKNGFMGIWNWDTAFHSAGVSRWDPELAREGLLGFMQFQKESGMFPDVINENGNIADTFSKPPVLAWACEIVYKRDKDADFLKKVYPMLVKNERYWTDKRCKDGLLYYDAEDSRNDRDYELHVRYESGWDNSIRWDKTITDLWAIDLNCFMVMTYRSMSFMAAELGLHDDAAKWTQKGTDMSKLINEKLWDDEKKFYSDANKFTGEVSDVLTPAGFMPLYIGIADEKQAACMARLAETKFNGKMPTVAFDNPEYSTDYWRGPTWLNVAYFAAKGLKNYGFEVADRIKDSIIKMCAKDEKHIYENYDSETGKGLCCDHFSWSCVFVIEFILNFERFSR